MALSWDVIVIGGGASGLMAAGRAAEEGSRVLLLEKMGRVGIKLAITGQGRCNLTNAGDLPTFIENFHHNGKFLYNAFSRFFNQDLISFFQSRGVPVVEERGRRIFPASNRAEDIVRVLRDYARSHGVKVLIHSPAREVLQNKGEVEGVRTEKEIFKAPGVILATGGASYSQTGSNGDGYAMALRLGHRLEPIRPALVPIEIDDPSIRSLQGLTLKNVRAAFFSGNRKIGEEFGEMIFTHFGVSGPIILTLSGKVVEALPMGKMDLRLDLKAALSPEQVENRLIREFQEQPRQQIQSLMGHLLPKSLVPLILKRTGVSPEAKGGEIRVVERREIQRVLKEWRLPVKGARPLEEAIVTAGGVAVREIHPATMESKIVKGLHFCGEVIDVDGKTGGYNLQAAFSTGWLAGEAAARRRRAK
ncbi:MAG: NAD(P)/FAD-dependent oxidoreductase [Deltaproteobacteria bacterium]|nr:NAD(P)/FAD-dependent oxidoreductase [Deltaproteobacteria bacterium]